MKKLDKILCTVDFTPNSYAAVECTSFLARLYQSDVTLLHVMNILPEVFGVKYSRDEPSQNLIDANTERARSLLRQAKRKYIPYIVKAKSSVRVGDVVHEILEEALSLEPDLLVMSTHGAIEGEDKGLGHFTRDILQGVHCPVLLLPGDGMSEDVGGHGFRNILGIAEPGLNMYKARSFLNDHLAQMCPRILLASYTGPDADAQETERLGEALYGEVAELNDDGLGAVQSKVLKTADPVGDLIKLAVVNDCDLVVAGMGMDGDHESNSPGAVTWDLIQQANIPILVFKESYAIV